MFSFAFISLLASSNCVPHASMVGYNLLFLVDFPIKLLVFFLLGRRWQLLGTIEDAIYRNVMWKQIISTSGISETPQNEKPHFRGVVFKNFAL
jgi:hypothetical protein